MSVPGQQPYLTSSAPTSQSSHDPTAVIGSRTVAWIIDAVIYLALAALMGPFGFLGEYEKIPSGAFADYGDACEQLEDDPAIDAVVCIEVGDRAYWTSGSDAAIQAAVILTYLILVYVVWQGLAGLTIGKAALGLRAVNQQGQAPGMGKALVRSLLWIVDGQPCGIPAVGFITGLTTNGHRRVGDMAAKTFVVRKADFGRPVVVAGLAPLAGYGAPPGAPPPPGTGYPPAPPTGPWSGGAPVPPGGQRWGAPPPTAPGPPTIAARPEPPVTTPPEDKSPAPTVEAPSPPSPEAQEPEQAAPETEQAAPTQADQPESDEETEAEPVTGPEAKPMAEPETKPVTEPETEPGSEPEPRAEETPTVEAPQAAQPPPQPQYKPQWDAARGTYIQWEPTRGQWLQWDDQAKQWRPIQ